MIVAVKMLKKHLTECYKNDDYLDQIGIIARHLSKRNHWGAREQKLKDELIKKLEEQKYSFFVGDPYRYGISQIGASALVTIPETQRGHLKPFRGERIRIVCVNTGRYKRGYMAGLI